MEKYLRDRKAIAFFVLPALLLFTAVIFVTIGFSLYSSLLRWDGIGRGQFIGPANYISLMTNETHNFIPALKNSLVLAAANLLIQLPVAIILAIVITDGVRGEKFFRTVYFIPVIIMTSITGVLWVKILDKDGLLNGLLQLLGLDSLIHNWLADPETAIYGVAMAAVWQWMGYYFLIMYSAVKGVSQEILESAQIDGAGKFRRAISIILPLISPMIKVCVIFMLVGSMKAFDLVYIMTGGGPFRSSEVPTVSMYVTIFRKYDYGTGSAMAIMILALSLIYAMLVTALFRKTEEISEG